MERISRNDLDNAHDLGVVLDELNEKLKDLPPIPSARTAEGVDEVTLSVKNLAGELQKLQEAEWIPSERDTEAVRDYTAALNDLNTALEKAIELRETLATLSQAATD